MGSKSAPCILLVFSPAAPPNDPTKFTRVGPARPIVILRVVVLLLAVFANLLVEYLDVHKLELIYPFPQAHDLRHSYLQVGIVVRDLFLQLVVLLSPCLEGLNELMVFILKHPHNVVPPRHGFAEQVLHLLEVLKNLVMLDVLLHELLVHFRLLDEHVIELCLQGAELEIVLVLHELGGGHRGKRFINEGKLVLHEVLLHFKELGSGLHGIVLVLGFLSVTHQLGAF